MVRECSIQFLSHFRSLGYFAWENIFHISPLSIYLVIMYIFFPTHTILVYYLPPTLISNVLFTWTRKPTSVPEVVTKRKKEVLHYVQIHLFLVVTPFSVNLIFLPKRTLPELCLILYFLSLHE